MVAPDSKSKEETEASFKIMMKELAYKIQSEGQSVRQFAAEIEVAVINIHQSHPQGDE